MNGSNFYTTVHSGGDEIAFMKAVIAYITGIDERITCENDPDYEYDKDNRGTSYVPNFNFKLNNVNVLTMIRDANLNTGSRGFTLYYKNNGSNISNVYVYVHQSSIQAYTVVMNRYINVSYITAENFILIDLHQWLGWDYTQNGMRVIYAKSGDNGHSAGEVMTNPDHYTKAKIFNISSLTFRNVSELASGTFTSRFNYKEVPGKIDYIKSCAYVSNNQKNFDITAIYDSTELQAVGDTVSLKDGAYLAVGLHQLVKVS